MLFRSMPCDAFSTSAILAESYSFIWQPWVLMKSLPVMGFDTVIALGRKEAAEPRSLRACGGARQLNDRAGSSTCASAGWLGARWRAYEFVLPHELGASSLARAIAGGTLPARPLVQ